MRKSCLTCAWRNWESVVKYYRGKAELYYYCPKKSTPGVNVRVTTDHKACEHYIPRLETK